MQARVKWIENVMFVGESGSGHTVVVDGAPEGGGRNIGMRPMELMLLSVGSCSSYDVMGMLKKSRQNVSHCEAEVTGTRVDAVPALFDTMHIHFKVSGKDLKEKQVARAIELSAEKYCSASIMMKNAGVKITHDFEIIDQG
ncbi:MAG: osmotically inducible protein C [SAR86 cluster bacterium]|uniref:Osmotically inducible protein C n=1 Tax=SAR86 cluster bacterium TaxID=2030880 RepID=A0A2A4MRD4_9GAMM|nr:MAG: osmotically inducible protein C [SAR86 cluster bacterium]